MAWHSMAWHGMAWHGMARRGVAWHGMALRGMAWYELRIGLVPGPQDPRFEGFLDWQGVRMHQMRLVPFDKVTQESDRSRPEQKGPILSGSRQGTHSSRAPGLKDPTIDKALGAKFGKLHGASSLANLLALGRPGRASSDSPGSANSVQRCRTGRRFRAKHRTFESGAQKPSPRAAPASARFAR